MLKREVIIEEEDLKTGELPLNSIIHGNTLTVLKKLPSESVDCINATLITYPKDLNTLMEKKL